MDLKKFRSKYKLTQQRFADMLGISRSTYKCIENGTVAPTPKFLDRLREVQEELENEQTEIVKEVIEVRKYNKFGRVMGYDRFIKTKEMLEEEKAIKELERIIG